MRTSSPEPRGFSGQGAALVVSFSLALCGCGPSESPTLVRVEPASRDAPITLTLVLEELRFVAVVENTGDVPVTLSPNAERIWLRVEDLTTLESGTGLRSVADAKPSIEIGETDDLFWLYPGETWRYPLDARLRRVLRGWVLETSFLSGDPDDISAMDISAGGARLFPSYVEHRHRTESAMKDPFFTCCDDEVVEAFLDCKRNRPDSKFRCSHIWIGDAYTVSFP